MENMSPSPRRQARKRQAFWTYTFWGRLFLFVLSSGIGGGVVGAIMGVIDWLTQSLGRSWWYWFAWIGTMNGLWMMIVGAFVGLVVFLTVELLSRHWPKKRKWRFARALKLGFFLPLAMLLALIPLLGSVSLGAVSGFSKFNWDAALMNSELLAIALLPVLLTVRLVYLSKSSRAQKRAHVHRQVLAERLLPLD